MVKGEGRTVHGPGCHCLRQKAAVDMYIFLRMACVHSRHLGSFFFFFLSSSIPPRLEIIQECNNEMSIKFTKIKDQTVLRTEFCGTCTRKLQFSSVQLLSHV